MVSDNDNINSTTNPTDRNSPWMLLLVLADDDVNNLDDYNGFCAGYDLNNDGVFDNDNASNGEGYVCMMTVTDSWFPLKMSTMMMISCYVLAFLMSVTNQVFILISSKALSITVLVVHASMLTPFPTLKWFTTSCSNL